MIDVKSTQGRIDVAIARRCQRSLRVGRGRLYLIIDGRLAMWADTSRDRHRDNVRTAAEQSMHAGKEEPLFFNKF